MQITNVTRGTTLATDAQTASGLWPRFRGLMMRARLDDGEGLDLRGDSSIHMMFMRFRIDAVFYDREGRVTSVARGLRPWTGLAFGGRGAHGVVEVAAGSAELCEPGDQLRWAA